MREADSRGKSEEGGPIWIGAVYPGSDGASYYQLQLSSFQPANRSRRRYRSRLWAQCRPTTLRVRDTALR
jgi:hypothetical protein